MHPSTIARRRELHQQYLEKRDKELRNFDAIENPDLRLAAMRRWLAWRIKHGLDADIESPDP